MTWASNGVNETLLLSISDEVLSDLTELRARLDAFDTRRDLSPAEQSSIAELSSKWEKYAGAVKDTLDAGRTDAPIATMMLGATDDDFQKVAADLQKLSALASQQTRSAAHDLVAMAETNKQVLAIGGIIGALLSIIVTVVVGRSIVKPIQSITRAMTEVSAGNTDFELGYQDRRDEIGHMVKAIASFRQNLQAQNLRLDTALNNMSQAAA